MLNIRLSFFLLFLLLTSGLDLNAQETTLGDDHLNQVYKSRPVNPHGVVNKTTGNAPFPFFDDFSYDSLRPSAACWEYLLDYNLPGVSVSKGYHPPSKGVATFDGATFAGRMYDNNDLARGEADSLTSLPIDLSAKSTADNIYLSFYVQPGGLGDFPEYVDSLILYFDTTGSYTWYKVWAMPGDSLDTDKFHYFTIPLDSSLYFHSAFRFKFENIGSLNGELDQWHLDYVYMDENRSPQDTTFNDQSVINIIYPPLSGYTHFNYELYNSANWFNPVGIEFANRNLGAASRNVKIELLDGMGNLSLSGTLTDMKPGVSIPSLAYRIDSLGPLSDQVIPDSGLLQLRVTLAGTDARSANDSMIVSYKIDSILGMDDGVADRGYGLTTAKAFAQEFTIFQPDTLTAVWINFVPSLYYNGVTGQVTSLENKSFKLTVWDDFHPDSILTQRTGHKVEYGDSLNQFFRYTFFDEVEVDSTFWVGIVQSDEMPVGVGFDRNFNNDAKIYYEAPSGEFVNTTQGGTLMIRCEFGNKDTIPIGIDDPVLVQPYQLHVFPHPAGPGNLSVQIEGLEEVRQGELCLRNIEGKTVLTTSFQQGMNDFSIPSTIPGGVYFLNFEGESLSGKTIHAHRKLIIAQ